MRKRFSFKFAPFVLLFTGLFFLSSCQVEQVEFMELKNVVVKDVKPKEIYLDVTAVLDNPNSFSIKIIDSDLDLYLEGNKLGKATLLEEFTLESGEQKAYDLKVKAVGDNIQMKMLPVMLSAALTGKVTVKLQGDITGRVALIKKKVKVDITQEVRFKKEL